MSDKPGPSKRSYIENIILRSCVKKRRTISEEGTENDDCSSEKAVFSQESEEEKDSESSIDSDCSIFETLSMKRKIATKFLLPSRYQQQSQPIQPSSYANDILQQTAQPATSSILQDYDDLSQISNSKLNNSAIPSVFLLKSTESTPELSEDKNTIFFAGTSVLRPQQKAVSSFFSALLPQDCFVSNNENEQSIKEETPSQQANWSTHGSLKTIEFNKTQGLLVPIPSDPFEAFRLFLNDDILDLIVRETNLNAKKILQGSSVKAKSRIRSWKDLTRQELLTFLGLLLHTGTIRLNRLNDYWKKHWLFNIPSFSQYISRNRFLLIMRCLDFSSEDSGGDKLIKIRPIMDHFNNRMNSIYYPGKQLSLDESIVLWRGRLLFRQYIKNERHKYGVKLHVLTEPEGLVLKFHIYASARDETAGTGHIQKIVFKLLDEKLDSGHSVYMDDYYNSYDLATKLLNRKTYCSGTLNNNRKGNPIDLSAVKLRKGENKSLFLNGVHIGKWKDKRCVLYISTEHDDEMLEVINKRGQVLIKPSAIVHYNTFMSGVDLQDQMLSYYPCERKTLRWYKKIFIHTLQMSLSNAFYLYNKYSVTSKMNLYDFRLAIIEKLLPNPNKIISKQNIMTNHKLSKIATVKLREKKDGNSARAIKEIVRKECKSCRENKKRVATLYECRSCHGWPGYCIECFFATH